MQFRKKAIVVEAEQFFPTTLPWPSGVTQYVKESSENIDGDQSMWFGWRILQWGNPFLQVHPGDWVTHSTDGTVAVFGSDYFHAMYEQVEE